MRQIINGKLYSTDSATLKAYWDNEGDKAHEVAGVNDDYVAHSLYRTQSGDYFVWFTDMRSSIDKLELLNEDSLMIWLDHYGYSDEKVADILEVEIA